MKRKMAELKEGINSRRHWLLSRLANAESVTFTTAVAFVSATGVCLRRRSRLGGLYVSSRAVRVSPRGRHGGRMVALLETLAPARVPAAQPSGLAGCGQQRPRLFDLVAALLGVCLICALPTEVSAISGGGLDYAGQQLSGQDLSKQKLAQKDFSGAICRGASFAGSDLSGARFFKADLTEADFHDAQLTGASLEQTVLRGSIFRNAVLRATYWTESVLQISDLENSDWTDALLEPNWQVKLCAREDAKGTNPHTNVNTRESLMCPD